MKNRDVGEVLKIIGGTICCVIALAAVVVLLYMLFTLPAAETECTFVKWEFINRLCEFGMRFTNEGNGMIIIPLSLAAILVEILLARPISYTLQKLPLGTFPESDIVAEMPTISPLTSLLPALIIGIHIGIYSLSTELGWTGGIEFSKNVVLVTVILVGVLLLFLLVNTILQAGLWGFLLRGSLIVVSNVGLSIGFGILAEMLAMLLIVITLFAFGLIVFFSFFRAIFIRSLF